MGIGVGVVSGILIGVALRSMILGISIGVITGVILGIVAKGRDIKRHVMGRTKIIIIGVIIISIVVFLVFSEYSYVLIVIYIVAYLLSPLIIYFLDKWEQ